MGKKGREYVVENYNNKKIFTKLKEITEII